MATGTIVSESLRLGAALEGIELKVRRLLRVAITNATPSQPDRWTLIDFEIPDEAAPDVAAALAKVLDVGGWYVDFHTADDKYVVFADKVFRYRRGHPAGRQEAAAYALAAGVPTSQLDWPE
jgi:hypothetical protein